MGTIMGTEMEKQHNYAHREWGGVAVVVGTSQPDSQVLTAPFYLFRFCGTTETRSWLMQTYND